MILVDYYASSEGFVPRTKVFYWNKDTNVSTYIAATIMEQYVKPEVSILSWLSLPKCMEIELHILLIKFNATYIPLLITCTAHNRTYPRR